VLRFAIGADGYGEGLICPPPPSREPPGQIRKFDDALLNLQDIKGQGSCRRAVEVACPAAARLV
jgi:predicted ATPase with chaperone activity